MNKPKASWDDAFAAATISVLGLCVVFAITMMAIYRPYVLLAPGIPLAIFGVVALLYRWRGKPLK